MRKLIDIIMFYLAVGAGTFAAAQIPAPQINLSGNIGCQGFPCVNSGTLIMASDANRTMTAQETSAFSIKVTSGVSLTATRNLVAPAGKFSFNIENATTGGQSIQIIGPSGTGVTIPNGQTVAVWNDGTNYVQVGASGGSSGVSSFNTRTGAVTLAAADVNAVGAITNSTTGNAATATGLASTPSTCSTGQAPVGITASGNATGCAAIGGGGSSGTNVVYASSLSCPTPGVDLTAGLMTNGTSPTSATTCLSAAVASATLQSPVTLILDNAYYGAIFGPAGGGWTVKGAHTPGIGRAFITHWSCVSGTPVTCTFASAGNTVVAGQYVNLGLFGTTTSFNQALFHVIATGLSSSQFEATAPTGFSTTGSATELGEADYIYGDGLFAPAGLNNDVISNHASSVPGGCASQGGHYWTDWGWAFPGPAPGRGGGFTVEGIAINGNRGNGANGNSTSGAPQGIGIFSELYASPYCSFMAISVRNMENVTLRNNVIYNAPAYLNYLANVGHATVTGNTLSQVFPNGIGSGYSGQNGDGVHVSGPANDIYIGSNAVISSDDAFALNAPEGAVGTITRVNIIGNTVHNALTGFRIYTGSIAPPSGDATPTVDHVVIDGETGDVTQSAGLFGLACCGRPTSTFTIPESINDVKVAHVILSGGAQAFQVDDTIGTLSFDDVDVKGVTCGFSSAEGFVTNWTNTVPINQLSIHNSHLIQTSGGQCATGFVDGTTGTLNIATLDLDGDGVILDGGTNAVPYVIRMSGSSSVGKLNISAMDMANIGTLETPNAVTTFGGQNYGIATFNAGNSIVGNTVTGDSTQATGSDMINTSSTAHWSVYVNGSVVGGTTGAQGMCYYTYFGANIPGCWFPAGIGLGFNKSVTWGAGQVDSTAPDTGLSRDSAGVVDVGNGSQGDVSGTLKGSSLQANATAIANKVAITASANVSNVTDATVEFTNTNVQTPMGIPMGVGEFLAPNMIGNGIEGNVAVIGIGRSISRNNFATLEFKTLDASDATLNFMALGVSNATSQRKFCITSKGNSSLASNGVGACGDPTKTLLVPSLGVTGTTGYGIYSTATTGATANYAYGSNGFSVDGSGNITSSALTSGNCVQASTGGLLTTTGAACGSGSAFPVYNASGTAQTSPHIVKGTVTVSGANTLVTLSGSAVYTSSTSYGCTVTPQNFSAAGSAQLNAVPTGASTFTIDGDTTGFTGTAFYICIGN